MTGKGHELGGGRRGAGAVQRRGGEEEGASELFLPRLKNPGNPCPRVAFGETEARRGAGSPRWRTGYDPGSTFPGALALPRMLSLRAPHRPPLPCQHLRLLKSKPARRSVARLPRLPPDPRLLTRLASPSTCQCVSRPLPVLHPALGPQNPTSRSASGTEHGSPWDAAPGRRDTSARRVHEATDRKSFHGRTRSGRFVRDPGSVSGNC